MILKKKNTNYLGHLNIRLRKKKWLRGVQTEEEYMSDVQDVRNIIKGNFKESIKKLSDLMNFCSRNAI